jgi:hypothetical protein
VLRIWADPRSRDNSRDPLSLEGAFLDAFCRPLCWPTPAQALASKGNTGIIVETVAERLILAPVMVLQVPKDERNRVNWRIALRRASISLCALGTTSLNEIQKLPPGSEQVVRDLA